MQITSKSFSQLLCSVLVLSGCTHLKNAPEAKVFDVNPRWAVSTLSRDPLSFRKINRAKPLLYRDWVIQGNSIEGLSSYSKETGKLNWRKSVQEGIESTGVLEGDDLYFGALDGEVYKLSAQTGELQWSFPAKSEVLTEVVVKDKLVYVLTANNSLYALDKQTGSQVWLYARQDTSFMNIRGGSKPIVKDGVLYAGFNDGAMVALNAFTGNVKWEKQLSRNPRFRDLDSDPIIDGPFIYLLGFEDSAYALRSATGELVWKNDIGGYGNVLMIEKALFYATTDGRLVRVNKDSGRLEWEKSLNEGSVSTGLFRYKDMLVAGQTKGPLSFLDITSGVSLGSFDSGRGVMSPIAIDAEASAIYFISTESNLYRLQADWIRASKFNWLK